MTISGIGMETIKEEEEIIETLPGAVKIYENKSNERIIGSRTIEISKMHFSSEPGVVEVNLVYRQQTLFDSEEFFKGDQVVRSIKKEIRQKDNLLFEDIMGTALTIGILPIIQGVYTLSAANDFNVKSKEALDKIRNGDSRATFDIEVKHIGKTKVTYKRVSNRFSELKKNVHFERVDPAPSIDLIIVPDNPVLTKFSATTDEQGNAKFILTHTFKELNSLSPMELIVSTKSKSDLIFKAYLTKDIIDYWLKEHDKQSMIAKSTPDLPPYAEVSFNIADKIHAGSKIPISITLTNIGKGAFYGLSAETKSEFRPLDGIKYIFGKIDPNESKTITKQIDIPLPSLAQQAKINIHWKEYNDFSPDINSTIISVIGKNRPKFAYSYIIIDDMSGNSVGNGDGRIQKGEAVDILFTIANVGNGKTGNVLISIVSPLKQNIFRNKDKNEFDLLKPGEKITARLTATITKSFPGDVLPIDFQITETDFGVALAERIDLPLETKISEKVIDINKKLVVTEGVTNVYGGAGQDTLIIAQVEKGNQLISTGQMGDWYRILIGENENGWVNINSVEPIIESEVKQENTHRASTIIRIMQKAPPVIALASPVDGITVSVDDINIIGTIADDSGIDRLEIRANGILFDTLAQRGISINSNASYRKTNLEFNHKIKLSKGSNQITLTAYDVDGLNSEKHILINRNDKKSNIFAAVIGISKYKNVHSLKYADNDADEFHNYLTSNLKIPGKNIYKITNEEATLKNMRDILGINLRKLAGKDDTVIIYYAGHGSMELDSNIDDGDGYEKYLMPYDADLNSLYSTAMPMDEIKRIFQRIQADRIIFIVDSCYSGASGGRSLTAINKSSHRGDPSDRYLERLSTVKGRVILTAGKANEVSIERDDLKHGIFTFYLLEALKGNADMNGDQMISLQEAYEYISRKVSDATNHNQNPTLRMGEIEGQIILGMFD
jgi:hypothetical protein